MHVLIITALQYFCHYYWRFCVDYIKPTFLRLLFTTQKLTQTTLGLC